MSTYFFNRHHVPVNRKVVGRRISANSQFVLPKGSSIRRVYFNNLNGNAVTGGVRIGTTNGGAEVVAATPLGANGIVDVAPIVNALAKADQTLFVQAATAWNGASVDMVVEYQSVPYQETEYAPGSLNLDASVGKAHSSQ